MEQPPLAGERLCATSTNLLINFCNLLWRARRHEPCEPTLTADLEGGNKCGRRLLRFQPPGTDYTTRFRTTVSARAKAGATRSSTA